MFRSQDVKSEYRPNLFLEKPTLYKLWFNLLLILTSFFINLFRGLSVSQLIFSSNLSRR